MHRDENVKAHFNLDFALPSHSTHTGPIFSRFHFSYIVTHAYVLSETYCLELVHHFTFDARGSLLPYERGRIHGGGQRPDSTLPLPALPESSSTVGACLPSQAAAARLREHPARRRWRSRSAHARVAVPPVRIKQPTSTRGGGAGVVQDENSVDLELDWF